MEYDIVYWNRIEQNRIYCNKLYFTKIKYNCNTSRDKAHLVVTSTSNSMVSALIFKITRLFPLPAVLMALVVSAVGVKTYR